MVISYKYEINISNRLASVKIPITGSSEQHENLLSTLTGKLYLVIQGEDPQESGLRVSAY